MLGNVAIARVVAHFLEEVSPVGRFPVVLDPVLRASSGASLLDEEAINILLERLLPQATCVTPNQTELSVLLGEEALEGTGLSAAGSRFLRGCGARSVIVTGGDSASPTDLLLEPGKAPVWLEGRHVATHSTHGTGCAFSSALLSRLVLGDTVLDAARAAKLFVEQGLSESPGVGAGKGPLKLSGPPYARSGESADKPAH